MPARVNGFDTKEALMPVVEIAVCIICYIAFACLIGRLSHKEDITGGPMSVVVGVFWPVSVLLFITVIAFGGTDM